MKNQYLRIRDSATITAGLALLGALSMVPPACAQNYGPWSAPVNLNNIVLSDGTPCPAVVNSPFQDTHPAISKDGLSLYFTSSRPGGFGGNDIWVTQRDSLDDCWKTPKNLGPVVNSASNDGVPNLTTDGHWLYFNSNRDGGADLYVSHRQDAGDDFGWETPINLGPTINIPGFFQNGPTHFEDDATGTHFLYYTQKPNPPPPPASNDDLYDIYVSTCTADLAACNTQDLWGPGTAVAALNSLFRDTRTAIRRRDGLEMILSSGRPGSLMSENLWVSTRPRVTTDQLNWAPPVPINCEWRENVTAILNLKPPPTSCPSWAPVDPPGTTAFVNSDAFDGAPALSWDGTELYFFRVSPAERNDASCQDTTTVVCGDLYVSKRVKLPD